MKNLLKKLFKQPPGRVATLEAHQSFNDLYYSSDFNCDEIRVPLQKCRSALTGMTLSEHPFAQSLKQYRQQHNDYQGSLLCKFYQQFTPETVADVFALDSQTLKTYPAIAAVLPWHHQTLEQRLARFAIESNSGWLSKEGIKLGLKTEGNFGCQYFGPVSNDYGELEFQRLTQVCNSILAKGYQPEKSGELHGHFLIDDSQKKSSDQPEDWCWVSEGGKHRTATLAALDSSHIAVANRSRWSALVIKRSDVAHWPNVKNGLFTKEQALLVFDRFIKGNLFIQGDPSLFNHSAWQSKPESDQ